MDYFSHLIGDTRVLLSHRVQMIDQ
jgi:hypothetical protein